MKMSNFAAEMFMRAPTAVKETADTRVDQMATMRMTPSTGAPSMASEPVKRFSVIQPEPVRTVVAPPPPPPVGQPAYFKPTVTQEKDNTYVTPPDKVVMVVPPAVRHVVDGASPTPYPAVVQPPNFLVPPMPHEQGPGQIVIPGKTQGGNEINQAVARHDAQLGRLNDAMEQLMQRDIPAIVNKLNSLSAKLDEARSMSIQALNTAQTADQNTNTLANNVTGNLGMFNDKVNDLGAALEQLLTGVAETFTPRRNTQQGDGISRGRIATMRTSVPTTTVTVDADPTTAEDTGRTRTVNGYGRWRR